jgi:hypothetical protein
MLAALENWRLLREKGCSLSRLLLKQPFSVLAPGSEFRPIHELEKLLQCHPLWPRWELALTQGAAYPLEDYLAADMALDLEAQLARGNHQSVLACLDKLKALNSVDVTHGYSFCLPVVALRNIEGTAAGPHGMAHQDTINEFGESVKKDRPTHDQTFSARKEGQSINKRYLMDLFTPCVFGHALLRIIHFVLHLCHLFPTTKIFIQKMDFKSAYRRMHLSMDMTSKCTTVVKDLAYLSLRLLFASGVTFRRLSRISVPR